MIKHGLSYVHLGLHLPILHQNPLPSLFLSPPKGGVVRTALQSLLLKLGSKEASPLEITVHKNRLLFEQILLRKQPVFYDSQFFCASCCHNFILPQPLILSFSDFCYLTILTNGQFYCNITLFFSIIVQFLQCITVYGHINGHTAFAVIYKLSRA